MQAVLLISHGSRFPQARQEIEALAERLKQKSRAKIFKIAFLEIDSPTIGEAIQQCVEGGAKEIIVLLNFLNAGNHVIRDIPQQIEESKKKHPNINFILTPHLAANDELDDVFLNRISAK